MREDFAAIILTRGRPDNVKTYKTLRRQGYTGQIIIVIDNEDETAKRYIENYGRENIVIIDKAAYAQGVDTGDLGEDRRCVVYARNACFDIAGFLGYRYFVMLDDDYVSFRFRFEEEGKLRGIRANNLDDVFSAMIDFLDESGALTVAFSQGGDFIGGLKNAFWISRIKRKAMNTFFCDVRKPFEFMGSINEDVNMYTLLGNRGELIMSIADVSVEQLPTQANAGGLTDIYLDKGTYIKSFYSVLFSPQCVTVRDMGPKHRRFHHNIAWDHCVPQILSESLKKQSERKSI